MCPALDLAFAGNRFFFRVMSFVVDQLDWTATGNPRSTAAFIMGIDSFFKVGCMSNVKTVINATNDVDEKGICWRRCGHGKARSTHEYVRSGHSTRPELACHERGLTRPSRMEPRGIEPRFAECDSAVIPLDHGPAIFQLHDSPLLLRHACGVVILGANARSSSTAAARGTVVARKTAAA